MKKKLTGVAVPLGALYTKDNSVIGEFGDLKPFADFCKAAGISIIQLLPVNDTAKTKKAGSREPAVSSSQFVKSSIYSSLDIGDGSDHTKRARRRASFRRRRAASFCLRLRMMLGFS